MKRVLFLACAALACGGCSYVGTWAKQSYYSFQLRHSPRQRTSKHLLDRQTHFVFGKVEGREFAESTPVSVLAVSPEPLQGEIVDVSQSVRGGSYYGLNLPSGQYHLVAVADLDGDGIYTEKEVIAVRSLELDGAVADKVRGGFDLDAGKPRRPSAHAFRIPVQSRPDPSPSLFYPKGTIRRLDDPIFSPRMASLGLYEPAAFMEVAPMMFYALEEELGHKVPVIFVHGIGGSARDFEDVVARLDRTRYRAWFFHYPSGGDLRQLGVMFYEIFLSGNTIPRQQTPAVIVAHSMGGLVVREALNRWHGTEREALIGSVMTIASPLGGHPAASRAAHAPVVIPSWRNLDPQSPFIRQLHRTPLLAGVRYHLFYTLGEPHLTGSGEPGDGVVPLESQLAAASKREAAEQVGFECSHTGVLHEPVALDRILRTIEETKTPFPEDHLKMIDRGGYELELPEKEFTAIEAYAVRNFGRYLDALVSGELQPFDAAQAQLVDECRGRRPAESPGARLWLKLARLYPDRMNTP